MENEVTLESLIKKYAEVPYLSQKEVFSQLTEDFEKNFVGTASQLREQEDSLMEKSRTIFKERRADYYEDKEKIEEEIKEYMFKECLVKNRAIFEKMYSLAYSEAHSGGFQEIYNQLSGYDSLVSDCLDIYKKENS